ncbi:MAG: energy-coupling factor ABC transporter ATP-binding protein [Sulfitobacter sp.]
MPDTTSSALIDISGASLTVDGKTLLAGIDLHLSARRVGIVGQNGSGKTSLARLVSGLIPPSAGSLRIDGVDVAKDRRVALGLVGILFQNPDHQIIFPTVGEELSFGLTQMGHDKSGAARKVSRILSKFDKSHWFDAHIHQLSQGQRQLVCLMAILVMQPKLIILDEPFSGLDIPTAAHLARILDGVEADLWHITHDPASVAGYDQVIWVDQGQIRAQGPATPILAQYSQYMQELGARYDLSDIAS